MPKLSQKMTDHLMALVAGERSAYPGLSLGTLQALEKRKLVACRYESGSMAFPQNCIQWRLTVEGHALMSPTAPDSAQ